MQLKLNRSAILATLLMTASCPLFSQAVPSANGGEPQRGTTLGLGGGVSSYLMDFGHGRMTGGTVWADAEFNIGPKILHGFGLEGEARQVAYGRSPSQPSNLREETVSAGVTYTWHAPHDIHPYGKFLGGVGAINFHFPYETYDHDTRTVTAAGGGVEARAFRRVWVRADYEYQWWPVLFNKTLDPQGVTLGVMYKFGHRRQ